MFLRHLSQQLVIYAYFGFFALSYIWLAHVYLISVRGKDFGGNAKSLVDVQAKEEAEKLPPPTPIDLTAAPSAAALAAACPLLRTVPPVALCHFAADKDGGVSSVIAKDALWEPDLTAAITKALESHEEALFVDVGAFIGYYSILAAKLGHRVLALEPFQDARELLLRSAQLNVVEGLITLYGVAASDKEEELRFLAPVQGNLGGRMALDSAQARFSHRGSAQAAVGAVALDGLAEEAGPPVVMKIDVEGWECRVVEGAKRLLRRTSHLLTEWSLSRSRASSACVRAMLGTLGDLGFRPCDLSGKALGSFARDPGDETLPHDVLWIRKRG